MSPVSNRSLMPPGGRAVRLLFKETRGNFQPLEGFGWVAPPQARHWRPKIKKNKLVGWRAGTPHGGGGAPALGKHPPWMQLGHMIEKERNTPVSHKTFVCCEAQAETYTHRRDKHANNTSVHTSTHT